MKRHAKSLQGKAKKHEVMGNPDGTFTVQSATSKKMYTVFALKSGEFRCVCNWAQYHPTRPCSHILTVREYLEKAGGRRLSFWADPDAVKKQHRRSEKIGLGLWATSRREVVRA